MDVELFKQLLTVSGPLGVLAYVMHLQSIKQSAAHVAALQSVNDQRVNESKHYAERLMELTADRKADRELMIQVVRDNSTAVTALVAKIDGLGWHHQRASDQKQDGSRNL
jgi:hypothetical protein